MQRTDPSTVVFFFLTTINSSGSSLSFKFAHMKHFATLKGKILASKEGKKFPCMNSTAKTFVKHLAAARTYIQNLAFQVDYMITNSEDLLLFC